MNRVYKVIWSKAKHCYVVTSEIAKSHTKGESRGRGLKKLAAALLLAAALMGPNFSWAADVMAPVKDTNGVDQIVYTVEGANGNFATKTDLDAKANAVDVANTYAKTADVASTYAKTADVASTYVKKDDAQVTTLHATGKATVDGNAEIGGTLNVTNNATVVGQLSAGTLTAAGNNFTVGAAGNVVAKEVETGTLHATGTATVDGNAVIGGTLNVTNNASVGTLAAAGNNFTVDATGNVVAKGVETGTLKTTGKAEIGGDLTAGDTTVKSLKSTGDIKADGDITGKDITGANVTVNNKLTTEDMEVKGEFKFSGEFKTEHITLGSKPDNYTEIDKGNVTSEVNDTDGGVKYTAESIFNKDGSSITARTDEGFVDSTGKSIVGAKVISQYLGDNAKPEGSQKNVTRKMVRNNDGTFSMEDKAVVEGKSSTVSQNAEERKVTVTDGTQTLNVTENLTNGIVSETNDGAGNKVTLTQGMDGTYKVETSGTSTEEISGQKIENYKGGLDTNITGNETHDVSGTMTTTVTGDSSLKAENITNEAKNKITNKARDVETDAASSIVSKVSNAAGSNTSTQWSYQTLEEMSQADGKTASYLRGAVEEKSELIDGSKKTTIDTIAGKTNTNITEGKNVSNSLQEANQIASSVTDGTNTTVVKQNAGSLASSITDGTKFNNTNNTVDKSEQQIRASDTQFSATSKTATKMEDALVSGDSVIDVMKNLDDAAHPFIGSAVTDGTNITVVTQTAKDITNTAEKGTIANNAKDITNNATENMTNTVGKDLTTTVGGNETRTVKGTLTETVTGNVTEDYKADLSTKVGGNETHAVTGNQTVTVSKDRTVNVKGTETENFNAQVTNVKTNQQTSVGGKQTNIVGGDQQNTVSGSKTETVNKAVTEKYGSQATTVNGDQSTNVGRNQSNVVKGNQTNTISGSKTESVKGAVSETYGSQNTKVNGDQSTTVTGKQTNSITGDQVNTIGGKQTTTVTGDSSLSATNIKNKASMSITSQIGEDGKVKSEMNAKGISNTAKNGTITNTALTVNTITGKNKVISDNDGTTFANEDAKTPFVKGGEVNTKITGNKVETGKVLTDDLTVRGTSEFVGRADFRNDVYVDENLTVAKETRTDTLYVDHDGYVGGNLIVDGNIETHDAELSENSRQVVTGRQLYQTNERVDRLDNRIKKVGANAAALAALRPGDFNPDDKFSIAAGFGSYRNANAAALGLFYRPNENVLLSLGTSFGDGENMVNAGVSVKFGRGKSMAERRKEMADEVSSMRDEMRSQDERIAELEEMLKKQSELIEKLSKES